MSSRLPTYFISHGGGPWPWLPDMRKMMATLETSLANMPKEIGETPKAILMVSGHWGSLFLVFPWRPGRPKKRTCFIPENPGPIAWT